MRCVELACGSWGRYTSRLPPCDGPVVGVGEEEVMMCTAQCKSNDDVTINEMPTTKLDSITHRDDAVRDVILGGGAGEVGLRNHVTRNGAGGKGLVFLLLVGASDDSLDLALELGLDL